MDPVPVADDDVAAVRAFTRAWTARLGVLREGLLDTPWSLTEARVLLELAQRPETLTVDLRAALGLDPGYLSRVLARLEDRGVIARHRSSEDARRQVLSLTAAGQAAFAQLDGRAAAQVRTLLGELPAPARTALAAAAAAARAALDGEADRTVVLREPEPGDLGWVVERHGAVYAAEHGFDATFERLVAGIVAAFEPGRRSRGWIAEVGGSRAGCVLCVPWPEDPETVAQLRCLLVEPSARGTGLGGRLVDECVRFARRAGYARMVLWTNDALTDARRVYERAGFSVAWEAPREAFGRRVVEQRWARDL